MATFIVLLVVIIIISLYLLGKRSNKHRSVIVESSSLNPKRKNSGVGRYEREKMRLELSGVSYDNRPHIWENINSDDILYLKFDLNNKFDQNAIGAYTTQGELLGYLPRNQRKVIKTLRENSNHLAVVYRKFKDAPRDSRLTKHFGVEIDIWLGFSENELNVERARFQSYKESRSFRKDINDRLNNAKELSGTNSDDALELYEQIALRIKDFNDKSFDHSKIRYPLIELMTLSNKLKKYDKVAVFFENYYNEKDWTEKQNEDILKKVTQARKKLGQ